MNMSKDLILGGSVLEDDSYRYSLGEPITVTSLKRKNLSPILPRLSTYFKEDKFMVRYRPLNEILFDKDYLEDGDDSSAVSLEVDDASCTLRIGKAGRYSKAAGVLAFSGFLSLNGFVEDNIKILGNSQISKDNLLRKVVLLAVGYNNGNLFGLFLLPQSRGLAVTGGDLSVTTGLTLKGGVLRDCSSWKCCDITDWFDDMKIEVGVD